MKFKKLIVLAALPVFVLALITACNKEKAPKADFDYTIDGKTVTFNNKTEGDGIEFTWSFGDGKVSNEKSPVHTYEKGGDYIVVLAAKNGEGLNEATKTITIEGGGGNPIIPKIKGADGVLIAFNNSTFTTTGGIGAEIKIGGGAGAFYDNEEKMVDVGAVSLNSNPLEKNESHLYSYYQTTGELINPVKWSVAGANGFSAINKEVSKAFPKMSSISSGTINTGADYTLTLAAKVTGSDSLIILLTGGSNTYQKIVENNGTSFVIKQSDIANLGASSTGLVSVSGYNYENDTIGGKNIYFVSQGNVTKTVEVK